VYKPQWGEIKKQQLRRGHILLVTPGVSWQFRGENQGLYSKPTTRAGREEGSRKRKPQVKERGYPTPAEEAEKLSGYRSAGVKRGTAASKRGKGRYPQDRARAQGKIFSKVFSKGEDGFYKVLMPALGKREVKGEVG